MDYVIMSYDYFELEESLFEGSKDEAIEFVKDMIGPRNTEEIYGWVNQIEDHPNDGITHWTTTYTGDVLLVPANKRHEGLSYLRTLLKDDEDARDQDA